ncbi:MAG TPA: MFS transporter [Erysipelotrichaceae bacterium]|nr:MFS transporter [Erysipelotrichaceae bacterium]
MRNESVDAFSKRKLREAAELSKLQLAQSYHQGKYYLAFLVVVLTVIYVVDEITSSMTSAMQPYAIIDLYNLKGVMDADYAPALANLTAITAPAMAILLISPFYKSLADKYGRKLFLILNTLGMGFGLFVACIAPNPLIYALAFMIITFFTPNDVQVMYIIECAPVKHRAKICSITKAIALVSCSLIGVFRTWFYNPEIVASWRYVYYIPVVIALLVGVGAILFVHETPVFTAKRLDYLRKSDEQRQSERFEREIMEKEQKQQQKQSGGVIKAIRYIFSNRQTRNITIAAIIFSASTSVTYYYTTFLQAGVETNVLTNANLDYIYVLFPFINGLITFIGGFINDYVGRKKSCLVFGGMAALGLTVFVFGAKFGFSPALIGCAYGLFIGGLWSISDTLYLVMPAESTPTGLRASVMGCMSLLGALGTLLSVLIVVIGQLFVGAANLGILCICICLPFMVVGLYLLMTRVQETKGVDLTAIEEQN